MDTHPLLDLSFTNIFSHSVHCLLVLLFPYLCRSFISWFSPNSLLLLLFPSLQGAYLEKSCWQMPEKLLPVLSSRIFQVSGLIFRSLIRFEFIFVCGVRKWSSFILLHVVAQFSQHHLLKTLSFIHWIFFLALLKINWSYSCEFFSGFSNSIPLLCVFIFVLVPY